MFDDRMHLGFSVALYWGNLAATWRSVDAHSLLLCSFLFLYIMITRCRVMIITGSETKLSICEDCTVVSRLPCGSIAFENLWPVVRVTWYAYIRT